MFFIAFSMINGVRVAERRCGSFVSKVESSNLVAELIVTKGGTVSFFIYSCRLGSLVLHYQKSEVLCLTPVSGVELPCGNCSWHQPARRSNRSGVSER
jgi:hypothetical protein